MQTSIHVRPARHRDFGAVAELLRDFAAQHHHWQPEQFRPAFLGFTAAIFATWLDRPDELILAAECEGEVVGYASASRSAGVSGTATFPRRSVHIALIVVAADRRRLGVGRALFSAIEAWAAEFNAEYVGLFVSPQNDSAKAFYTSLGYDPTGEVRAKTLRHVKRFENEP